jgi:hypothetical protein
MQILPLECRIFLLTEDGRVVALGEPWYYAARHKLSLEILLRAMVLLSETNVVSLDQQSIF